MDSPRFSINKAQLKSWARGCGYAAGGAVCAYLLTLLPNVDFGVWTPMAVAMFSAALNFGVKYFSGQPKN